jgi:16S rRNA (cytosine1402-N4)-methyltransferase
MIAVAADLPAPAAQRVYLPAPASIHKRTATPAMNEQPAAHVPVLAGEAMQALAPHAGGRYLDGTVGLGGHAEHILELSAPDGRLLGLDKDRQALALAAERLARFGDRVMLVHCGYEEAAAAVEAAGLSPLDGLLLDLGLSSMQLDAPERGFSFRHDAPLDMRFDPASGEATAADLVNSASEDELADVLWRYGEEPASRRIARAIVRERPLASTAQLARLVERVAGRPGARRAAATRAFQALRIAVNRELDNLQAGLSQAPGLLRRGGRLVVISFHSLEDRIVKQFIQRESRDCVCPPGLPACRCGHIRTLAPVTRGAVRPSLQEQERNPRSRSARLRAATRV